MADEEHEDLDKIRKLPASERLKKLTELTKKQKKSLDNIDALIKKSKEEIRLEKSADDQGPNADTHIENIVTQLEDQEELGRRESPTPLGESTGYNSFMRQIHEDYGQLQSISYASMQGSITPAQRDLIDEIGERLDKTKYHGESAAVADLAVASRSVIYKIRRYQGLE